MNGRRNQQVAEKPVKTNIIVGQGLAGSAIAWSMYWAGEPVLIYDSAQPNSASRVAAGLITPITGKRLVISDDYHRHWQAAKTFYRRVEQETGASFFTERNMLRLFADESSRQEFLNRSEQDTESPCRDCKLQRDGVTYPAIELSPAGRLDVNTYLSATRAFFEVKGCYRQAELPTSDLGQLFTQSGVQEKSECRIVLATGAASSKLFPEVPSNPAHGEVLSVRIPQYQQSAVVHRSIWIAPDENGRFTVGSTYDWNRTDGRPSTAGRDELLSKLARLVSGKIEVLQHTAGVRPTMKDYEPVIGQHPDQADLFVVNGLGSKGVLKAPSVAEQFLALTRGHDVSTKRSYDRLRSVYCDGQRKPLTAIAQQRVAAVLQPGDTAIDATVGNGFDTTFLADTVTATGRVVGFDIQASALNATRQRLASKGHHNVSLIEQSHELMDEVVDAQSAMAVMFNLGYLPRSDHRIITKAESTRRAIRAGFRVLKAGGVMTILSYRGHEGGPEEFEAVQQLLSQDASDYDLERINSIPAKANSPVLYVITVPAIL